MKNDMSHAGATVGGVSVGPSGVAKYVTDFPDLNSS